MPLTLPETWLCPRCKLDKPPSEFPQRKKPGRPGYCKPCQAEWGRDYRKNNRERIRVEWAAGEVRRRERDPEGEAAKRWRYYLKYRFNITPEQYGKMLEEQEGLCGMCHKPESHYKRLAVDHDRRCCPLKRSCGKCVRGLLCSSCNTKFGLVELFWDRAVAWRDRRADICL